MASIYNVQNWDSSNASTGWKKDDIVKKASDGTYWYAKKDHTNSGQPDMGSLYWDGNISVTVDGSAQTKPYFFWKPSYNLQTTHQPKVVELSYGDGYTQRLKNGINNDMLTLSLSFDNRSERESAAIFHFFKHLEGYKHFYFLAPAPYSIIKKFVCSQWNGTMVFKDNHTVTATLIETA